MVPRDRDTTGDLYTRAPGRKSGGGGGAHRVGEGT